MSRLTKATSIIGEVLEDVARGHWDLISRNSNIIRRVNLGEICKKAGMLESQFYGYEPIFIPISKTLGFSQLEINGLDFRGFFQLESHLIVPEWLAIESTIFYEPYNPPKKLIYCCE